MKKYLELSRLFRETALRVLDESGIKDIWEQAGCRVNIVGSLKMNLMAKHKDIDLHVYSSQISAESSLAIVSQIAKLSRVKEIKCINGLNTDERCMAWHILYESENDGIWQFDIIHILEGSRYDGYFEDMANRITDILNDEKRETILMLKFETPLDKDYKGVEYYEAVIADNVRNMDEFEKWVVLHRSKPPYYWMP